MKLINFKRKSKMLMAAIGFSSIALSPLSSAAPVPGAFSGLPMPMAEDIQRMLENNYITSEETESLMTFISETKILPEHDNPSPTGPNHDVLNDRDLIKRYNLVPVYSPVASGQAASLLVAQNALDVIKETFELENAIGMPVLSALGQNRGELVRVSELLAVAERCAALLPSSSSSECGPELQDLTAQQFEQYISVLEGQLEGLQDQLVELEAQIDSSTGIYGISTIKFIADQVRLKYAELGYRASQNELSLIQSNDPQDVVTGLASMKANVTGLGTYAIKSINYRAGYTEQHYRFLQAYLTVRPDVKVRTISGNTTRVLPTASSIYRGSPDEVGTGLELATSLSPVLSDETVSAFTLIKGVNVGSDGVCGGSTSCAVSVEYTREGALAEIDTRFGTDLPGIIFSSDMVVAAPAFHGRLDCHTTLGFSARGSQGVSNRGGGFFRSAKKKVWDNVKYNSESSNDCSLQLIEGSQESAEWHYLDALMRQVDSFYFENMQHSQQDLEEYRNLIQLELQLHANGVIPVGAANRFGQSGINSWRSLLGNGWASTLTSFVTWGFGGAGTKYSRSLNTEVINNFDFVRDINISENTTVTRRIEFESNTMLCWNLVENGRSQLQACDLDAIPQANNAASQLVGSCVDLFNFNLESEECFDLGNDLALGGDNNNDGVVDDPTVVDENAQIPVLPADLFDFGSF